jgi:hypothetical protein
MQRLLGSKEYKFERIEFVPAAINQLSASPGAKLRNKKSKVLTLP